jgi:cyclic pyranopterin phosphate synthase
MPETGICLKDHSQIISFELIERVVEAAITLGITKVRLTGGEPLVRRGLVDLVGALARLPGLRELTLTTNGILLPRFAADLRQAGMDRVNVSLDTLDPEKYRDITRGGKLADVMAGIESLKQAGFSKTKINMVLIPGFNDDEVPAMQEFCRQNGLSLQRIHHYQLSSIDSIDMTQEAERPKSCSLCNRIRLTADGMLKPCLFSEQEIPLDPDQVEASLRKAILGKPLHGCSNTSRDNWQIGG